MEILSVTKLDQVCRYLAGYSFEPWEGFNPPTNIFDRKQNEFNEILYKTGLRYIELFEVNRWGILEPHICAVVTAKGSNQRIFTEEELTPTFFEAISTDAQYWWTCRFDSLSFYYQKHIANYQIQTGSKYLNTHLFRHNKVKQMISNGATVRDVSMYLGEVSDENTIRYRDSVITKI